MFFRMTGKAKNLSIEETVISPVTAVMQLQIRLAPTDLTPILAAKERLAANW
jgi:hypothetical protein